MIKRSEDAEYRYFTVQQESALGGAHLDCLRATARGEPGNDSYELLKRCGLIVETERGLRLADPVLAWSMPPPLRIHHVSDIHAGAKSASAVDAKARDPVGRQLAEAAGAGPVRDRYLAHVSELAAKGQAPHLLVVSGDLGEWGKPEEFAEVRAWLTGLENCLAHHPRLGATDPRVLIVGGNHDVGWTKALGQCDTRERHRPFADAFGEYPCPRLYQDPEQHELARVSYSDLGVEFALLGSAEFGGEPEQDPVRQELLDLVEKLRAEAADDPQHLPLRLQSVLQRATMRQSPTAA